MRDVPASMTNAWNSGMMFGDAKPAARVTVQHPTMRRRNYSMTTTFTEKITEATIQSIIDGDYAGAGAFIDFQHGHRVHQSYADYLFSLNKIFSVGVPKEIPNIKSIEWTRNVDQEVADCTITLWNTKPLAIGEAPDPNELDFPGYYTYSRGASKFSKPLWGQEMNEWFGMLLPDNIIRTYEGYGCDPTKVPELDPFLVQTGLWVIDSVQMSAFGTMSLKCRDIGRILIDQYYLPPVVPKDWYDEGDWKSWDEDFAISKPATKLKVIPEDSSNTPWISSGIVAGHKLSMAFDGNPNSYWLSIGNSRPSKRYAYEWVQAKVSGQSVSEVRVRARKKGYTAYVSVMVGGTWQGSNTINYHRDGIGQNGGNIAYVAKAEISTEGEVKISLPKTYAKVQRIRVTFGNLQNFNIGTYHYRAGIREVAVYSPSSTGTTKLKRGPAGSNPNRYYDYTDIVKLLCAWGGFFWPNHAKQRLSDTTGTTYIVQPHPFDTAVLGKGVKGRVWGDFLNTGVSGVADLALSNFDKKPLMDGIVYIKNIVGFVFFFDETGGAQWRMPNITNRGCLRSTLSSKPAYLPDFYWPIRDDQVIITLDTTLDYKNVRESNFVGDYSGKLGAYAPGFNPNPTGLVRMGVYTDGNFAPKTNTKKDVRAALKEARLTADLLSLRQLFTYRSDKVRIPAYPAIQVDDQIRLYERTTAEGYIHYVKGISSSMDLESGEWTYDLDTHWLGYDPDSTWIYNPADLHEDTKTYLELQTQIKKAFLGVSRRTDATTIGNDGASDNLPVPRISTTVTGRAVRANGSASTDSDGRIVKYAWNFGDTKTAQGPVVTHKYAASGIYIITLTVTDDVGGVQATTRQITIGS